MCDENDVSELRKEVMVNGVITKEEVEMLWKKKNSQGGNTSPEFDAFFAEVVMAWLLVDDAISVEKAYYIIDKINEDNYIDDAESELLESIVEWNSEEGHEIPQIFIYEFPNYFKYEE